MSGSDIICRRIGRMGRKNKIIEEGPESGVAAYRSVEGE